jgi:hypothetical protein
VPVLALPLAARRDQGCRYPHHPWAVLDALQPTPSTALLSAGEAKKELREIVEGFFFRRLTTDGKPIRHLLVKSPPGLGKTKEAMEWATHYQVNSRHRPRLADITNAGVRAQVAIFVPRHELARAVKDDIEGKVRDGGERLAPHRRRSQGCISCSPARGFLSLPELDPRSAGRGLG